jgi:hypothetical protein
MEVGIKESPDCIFWTTRFLAAFGRQVGTEGVLDFIYSVGHVRDLLLCAKHLFVAAIVAG